MPKAHTFTVRFAAILLLGAAGVVASPANATVVSQTNSIYSEVDDDFGFRTFTFGAGDFSGSSIVTGVTIALNFSKCYSGFSSAGVSPAGCGLGTSGLSYPYEIGFALGSPAGTRVALVENDGGNEAWETGSFETYEFGSYRSYPHTETLFDDSGKALGKYPADGTFAPEGSLSSFIGESAIGEWTLFFEDDYPFSPLGLHEATLNIEVASVAPVPAPRGLILLSLGLVGLLGLHLARRREAA